MWNNRIVSALLAVALTAAVTSSLYLAGVPLLPREAGAGVAYEAAGVPDGETVASVDGNNAPAELYTFWLGSECANLERYYGIDVASNWDMEIEGGKTLRDFIHEDTMTAIKQQLVLENLAARYGVTLSAEDESELAAQRASYVEQFGGEEGYAAELAKLGISEAGFDRLSRTDYLYKALHDLSVTPGSALYADDTTLAAYAAEQGYITADHILLMTLDPQTREPLDEAAREEKRQQAEDLLWQLRDSRDPAALFQELADQYSEDTGRAMYPDGYTFTRGTMVDEFDAAARALEEGEYSDVVESPYGYHIILRKPLDTGEAVNAVRDDYFDAFFLKELDAAELKTAPALERMEPAAIYDALKAAQAAADETDVPGDDAADASSGAADAPAAP